MVLRKGEPHPSKSLAVFRPLLNHPPLRSPLSSRLTPFPRFSPPSGANFLTFATRCVFFSPLLRRTHNACRTILQRQSHENRERFTRSSGDPCQMRAGCIHGPRCFFICPFASHGFCRPLRENVRIFSRYFTFARTPSLENPRIVLLGYKIRFSRKPVFSPIDPASSLGLLYIARTDL